MGANRLGHSSHLAFWGKFFGVAAVYLLLQTTLLWLDGEGWQKFWVLQPHETFEYWDAIHYANLAVGAACSAFYPLWPGLARWLASPPTTEAALRITIPLSEAIFLGSLPLALWTFERIINNRRVALLAFVLYALGPNAVFYAIGYTEALFGGLSLLLLVTLHRVERHQLSLGPRLGLYGAIVGLSMGLNLVRPALVQTGFAIAFTLTVLFLIRRLTPGDARSAIAPAIPLAALIGVGSLVGYSLYGLFCLRTIGNFLGPFQAQVEWGRTLAFRPWLLLFPRSLLIDIHGLYTPFLIFAAMGGLLWAAFRHRPLTFRLPRQGWVYLFLVHPLIFSGIVIGLSRFAKRWTTTISIAPAEALERLGSFTVLYAIAFSGVHSIINFLANSGYLYSTSRHYFGSPYAFVAIGVMLTALSVPQLNRLTWVIAGAGLLWLGEQWWHYGSGRWLG